MIIGNWKKCVAILWRAVIYYSIIWQVWNLISPKVIQFTDEA